MMPESGFSRFRRGRRGFLAAAAAGLATTATLTPRLAVGQARIDITRGQVQPMPIAVSPFHGAGAEASTGRQIRDVVAGNLERCGLFRPIEEGAYIQSPEQLRAAIEPRFVDWRQIGAQALAHGFVEQQPDGRLRAASSAAGPGSAFRGTPARRTATGTPRVLASTSSASVWRGPFSPLLPAVAVILALLALPAMAQQSPKAPRFSALCTHEGGQRVDAQERNRRGEWSGNERFDPKPWLLEFNGSDKLVVDGEEFNATSRSEALVMAFMFGRSPGADNGKLWVVNLRLGRAFFAHAQGIDLLGDRIVGKLHEFRCQVTRF
jgi:hypothetical protein